MTKSLKFKERVEGPSLREGAAHERGILQCGMVGNVDSHETNCILGGSAVTDGRDSPRSLAGSAVIQDGGGLVMSLKVLEETLAPKESAHVLEQVKNSVPGKLRKIYQSSISMTEEEMEIAESGRANIVVRDEQIAAILRSKCKDAILEELPPLPWKGSRPGCKDRSLS